MKEEFLPGSNNFEFQVLAVLKFSPERRRMSIVLSLSPDWALVICKGAADVMAERLNINRGPGEKCFLEFEKNLLSFQEKGMRTVVYGMKVVSSKATMTKKNFFEDENNIDVESGLTLLGCTAMEEELCCGVTESVRLLQNSTGLKVWMATGDSAENAVCAAKACGLVCHQTFKRLDLLEVAGVFRKSSSSSSLLNSSDILLLDSSDSEAFLAHTRTRFQNELSNNESAPSFLVVSGTVLELLITIAAGNMEDYKTRSCAASILSDFVMRFRAVLLVNAKPKQKGLLVSYFKKKLNILAIGDGENDALMLKESNVGVGLYSGTTSGISENAQIMVSDFSALPRLLFIHGEEARRKTEALLNVVFFRSALPVLFYFGFYSILEADVSDTLLNFRFTLLYNLCFVPLFAVLNVPIFSKYFNF